MEHAISVDPVAVVEITIPGEPHAQARPRARVIEAKGRSFVQMYEPSESRNWKAMAHEHMQQAFGVRHPFAGAVELTVIAYFTCPRSKWRKREPRPAQWHTGKPDGDNVLKAVKDAAKGVLWLDDAQVAVATIRKIVAAQGEGPRILLRVRELAEHQEAGNA
jgi:Holliday junction resolvase RusA-like endonuclease